MLKGVQRQMVEMRTDKSELFERAYFVLRENGVLGDGKEKKSIVDEANRIIEGVIGDADAKEKRRDKKRRGRRRAAVFIAGLLCGAGLAAVASIVLAAI